MENSNFTEAHDSTESADAQIISEALPILDPSNWRVRKNGYAYETAGHAFLLTDEKLPIPGGNTYAQCWALCYKAPAEDAKWEQGPRILCAKHEDYIKEQSDLLSELYRQAQEAVDALASADLDHAD